MLKKSKKLISMALAVVMMFTMSTSVFATDIRSEMLFPITTHQVQPRINLDFDFEVKSPEWTIMSFDWNLLNQKLVVSGSDFQPSLKSCQLRILYTTGAASPAQTLSNGRSVTFNNVPLIGWKLQVRASNGTGWGHFTIKD